MKNSRRNFFIFLIGGICMTDHAFGQSTFTGGDLRVVLIRHAEKPLKGDNLNCQGLNRSMELPKMLISKYGLPRYTYVPAIGLDSATRHSRMLQTVIPLAAKYNLTINSKYDEKDSAALSADIKKRSGTVLVVWEHHAITSIVRAFGMPDFNRRWDDRDYESIWIVTFHKGIPGITYDKERLNPSTACPF
jgi:hypothetical protein